MVNGSVLVLGPYSTGGCMTYGAEGGDMYSSRELLEKITSNSEAGHAIDLRVTRIEELIVLMTEVRKDQESRLRVLEKVLYIGFPILQAVIEFVRRATG